MKSSGKSAKANLAGKNACRKKSPKPSRKNNSSATSPSQGNSQKPRLGLRGRNSQPWALMLRVIISLSAMVVLGQTQAADSFSGLTSSRWFARPNRSRSGKTSSVRCAGRVRDGTGRRQPGHWPADESRVRRARTPLGLGTLEYPYAVPLGQPAATRSRCWRTPTATGVTTSSPPSPTASTSPPSLPVQGWCHRVVFPTSGLRDTDGDGRADERTKLYGPLGYERDTHGMQSSFTRGLDWLHITHGFNNNTTVNAADGSSIRMNSGNTTACNSRLERAAVYLRAGEPVRHVP